MVVPPEHKMLDEYDSDERTGPVPNQSKEIRERVIEPMGSYDS